MISLITFSNTHLFCTQIETNQRAKVKDLIEKNGGTYSPTLRFDVLNTVLVLNQPVGDKYRYAKKKNSKLNLLYLLNFHKYF